MKRALILAGVAVALFGAALAGTATPALAKKHPTKHKVHLTACRSVYWAPQYLRIRHVFASGTTCTVARGLARSYMNATTQSTGPGGGHTGQCFGRHSYGRCNGVRFHRRAYSCFHYLGSKKSQRGLVRCTRRRSRVSFNVKY